MAMVLRMAAAMIEQHMFAMAGLCRARGVENSRSLGFDEFGAAEKVPNVRETVMVSRVWIENDELSNSLYNSM